MPYPWKQAIVVGASSGMGAEIARKLAKDGCRVGIVARRKAALDSLAEELGDSVRSYPHDVTAGDVPGLFQRICRDLGGLDLIVYAAGVMPRIADDEYSFEQDSLIIDVNVTGAVAWVNEAAQRFAVAQSGTIVGISSVAGDRGRKGNPVYCASKAALNTYLEALRNRVGRFGVAVVTIKAGPVDTPMTKGLAKLPMLISAERAAASILNSARSRKNIVYVPGKWRLVMFIVRNIPSFIFKKLNI